MPDELKSGDVVFLKSEPSVTMTINWVDQSYAYCVWFHPISKDLKGEKFVRAMLEKKNEK